MTRHKQQGSIHLAIIIILVIGLLGAVGYIFWQNFTAKTPTSDTAKVENKPADKPDSKSDKTQPTAEYINLADWNVKLEVPTGLDKTTLKYQKDHIAEAPEYYGFTTTKIVALGNECAMGHPYRDMVSLQRTTSLQTAKDNAASYGGEVINDTAVGGYFYFYETLIADITPVPACAVTAIATNERNLLIQMVKKLTSY